VRLVRRLASVVGVLLVLAASGAALAKVIQAPARAKSASGQQAPVASPAGHRAVRASRTLSLHGTVCGLDEKAKTITFMVERTAQLEPSAQISSKGKSLRLSEVKKGDKVVVMATERQGKLLASRVEVVPTHPTVASTPSTNSKFAYQTSSGPRSHGGQK
jgi:Cu/Ag efflux protein CusF